MDVKKLREQKGITQQELADKTGIPRDRIAKWEQGRGSPKIEDYNLLNDFFNQQSQNGKANDITGKYISLLEKQGDLKNLLEEILALQKKIYNELKH